MPYPVAEIKTHFSVHVAVHVQCEACGARVGLADYAAPLCAEDPVRLSLPVGWQVLNGRPVCPAHTVVVQTPAGMAG